MSRKTGYLVLAIAAILWCSSFTIYPFLMNMNIFARSIAVFIKIGFSPVCHQIPERSWIIMGYPMAVCSRCAGIYYGGLIGILCFPWLRKQYFKIQTSLFWIGLAALPMMIDFTLTHVGLSSPGNEFRAITGILPGWISACYIVPAILEWMVPEQQELPSFKA